MRGGHLEHVVPAIRRELVRAEERGNCACRRFSFITSRRYVPCTRVASAVRDAGLVQLDRVLAKIRQPQISAAACRRWRADCRPCVACPWARARAARARSLPSAGEQLLGLVAAHPLLRAAAGARVSPRAATAAPDASASCLRPACRRLRSGPVQPFGVCSTSIGQRGRSLEAVACARRVWISRMRSMMRSSVRAIARCVASLARLLVDEERLVAVAAAAAASALRAECARAPSGSRSCSRSNAGSAAPRHRAPGLRNLFECQLVASGPVSASPSPMTQATIRSGLSNAAPYACDSA